MIAPIIWADTPFKNRTALIDFQGQHMLYHQVMVETIAALGVQVPLVPLGDGVGSPIWQDIHQNQHATENAALGISTPPSLTDYDFSDPAAFAAFMWIHAQATDVQRLVAGIS